MNITEKLTQKNIRFEENISLSEHSTFRIGGVCKLGVFPSDIDKLTAALDIIRGSGEKFTVIGNGSNVLFPDEGYDGVMIFTKGVYFCDFDGGRAVTCGCGTSLTELSSSAGRLHGLSGFEFAYGIPGTVGGAVFMNAGAYGGQISDILTVSKYFDLDTGRVESLSAKDHGFGYRHSTYMDHPERIILSAAFAGSIGDPESIKAKMYENMESRRATQPLTYPNAGSVFKRPEGYFAGKLIEDAGLKGFSVGGAQVSEKHAGFIVNRGGATADDVCRLIDHITETVYKTSGVTLECEIRKI